MSIPFYIAADDAIAAPIPAQTKPFRPESSQPPKPKAKNSVAPPEFLTSEFQVNPVALSPPPVLGQSEAVAAPNSALVTTDAIAPPEPLTSDQRVQWSGPPATTPRNHQRPAMADLTNVDETTSLITQIEQYTVEGLTGAVLNSSEALAPLNRTPLVHQLSDVKPTDWAAKTLNSLAERYDCPEGHWDQIFQGNQPLSRHEFAAGVAACLRQVPPEAAPDRLALQQLAENFQTELEALDEQIDHLEAATTTLAANQFSTTTHLTGRAIFALVDAFGEAIDVNPTFGSRLRLNLTTRFTGQDRLRITLGATNVAKLDRVTGFNETRVGFDGNTRGDWEITNLNYRFPLNPSVRTIIGVRGLGMAGFSTPHNPFLVGTEGSLSRFGQRNPIYRVPRTGAGGGAKIHFTDNLSLDVGYSAGEAARNTPGSGFFNGDYGLLAQLNLQANPLHLGLTYIHSYTGAGRGVSTGAGSQASQLNKLGPQELERPVVGNSFGVEISYDLSDRVAVGGWVGYTAAQVLGLGRADVWNWAITLAFPDLGREGNLGGILVGMQPRLTRTSSGLRAIGQFPDPDIGLHIEAFYRHEVNHHLSITPGFILLTAPDHNTNNAPALIGTIRTVFKF